MLQILLDPSLNIPERIIYLCVLLIILIFSLSIHEVMHGYAAYKMGDDTSKLQGRLTLNPLVHLEPIGTLMMLVAGFGWAKPVPVNYNRLKRFKDRFVSIRIVSLAGVTANFAVAFVSYLLLTIFRIILYKTGFDSQGITFQSDGLEAGQALILIIELFLYYMYYFNLMLMAFNLLPLPPLDGYHFVETFLPYKVKQRIYPYERYFGMALFGLIILGRITGINILGIAIDFISTPFDFIITTPIDLLSKLFVA
jgi:Zn-dependent protease